MGIKGNIWRVVRSLYVNNRSCNLLEGESSDYFFINQGVAQGCTFSHTLFKIFINGLLCEIEKRSKLSVKFPVNKVSGF